MKIPTPVRHGFVAPLIVFGLLALILAGGAAIYYFKGAGQLESIAPILTQVTRGEFVSQVLDQGEIQSSENVEIRCEVRARNGEVSVIAAIPEGSMVKAGDFLVQLDSASFEKELEEQKIKLTNAETAKIQAESALASAEAALNEYVKGTFVENQKTIENEIYDAQSLIITAQQELKQAQAVFEHSKKLHAKAFITKQTLEADEFAVQRSEIGVKKGTNSLELANQKMTVLKEITFEKQTIQLESDIKAAKVKLASEIDNYNVEKSKLTEIIRMIKKCTILVPEGVSGQVVYGKESSRGGNDWTLEEGASVRENQVLIRLPNPSKMEVKALINEQSITQIATNMPASIKVDALNNKTLKGVVTKVNQYAESSGWMTSSVRKYAVFVRIINPPDTLKPGMNASVAVQTRYKPDALLAPIQSVYGVQDKQFCLAKVGENQWKTLEVETGGDNSQMVMFNSGVEEGTQLVMNPGAYKEYMDLPEMKLDTRIEVSDDELGAIGRSPLDSEPMRPDAAPGRQTDGQNRESGAPNSPAGDAAGGGRRQPGPDGAGGGRRQSGPGGVSQ